MFFLNPTYLWAFLGLAVPIAIHLWSKKEGKTIKIGSVQFLRKADTKQSRSIKLNEYLLLLLRLLLIGLLVIIMADLHFRKKIENVAITYIVESSLLQSQEFKSILDTISIDVPIRSLQLGFPEIDLDADNNLKYKTPNYWQLAKEMQTMPTDSIIVFTRAFLAGFKGPRPEINKHIEWIPISLDTTNQRLLEANHLDEHLELLVMNSSDQHITFDKELLQVNDTKIQLNKRKDSIFFADNWTKLNRKKTIEVLLFYDAEFNAESKYIDAGLKVVSNYLKQPINLNKTSEIDKIATTKYDFIFWFSEKPILATNATVVLFESNPFATYLIEESSIQGVFHLTNSLNSENTEREHLPEQLIQLLGLNQGFENRIEQYDSRIMDKKDLIPTFSDKKVELLNHNSHSIQKWLWALFIVALISERVIAYYRTQ